MEEYDEIFEYLSSGTYPEEFEKNQKRMLRRKSIDHYKVLATLVARST